MLKLSDFDHFWDAEPPTSELSKFIGYLQGIMYLEDMDSINAVLCRPTKETNKLMMITVLRGLYAYRRINSLPEWDLAVIRVRDWLDERGTQAETNSALVGLIDRSTRSVNVL